MLRHFGCIALAALLFPALPALAGKLDTPQQKIGILSCKILPHSGINLLIHSTRDIRCEFNPVDSSRTERYKGETGIEFGLDINLNKRSNISYSVLSNHFVAGSGQLSGKYTGAGGGISIGVTVGDSAPLRKNGGHISLQPIRVNNSGSGAAAGFTYLYLEEEKK